MSEFQYYEFRALDRGLTPQEMETLRQSSSRADITSHRFVNFYSYANARFSPKDLVEKYFDVFLYLANWGTHEFMVRVPRGTFALRTLKPYIIKDLCDIWASGDNLIFHFTANTEGGGGWVAEEEGEEWLDRIVAMRDDLLNGDLRAVYIGWLATLFQELRDEDDDAKEPPVPPGLGQLGKSLQALADFLWIDPNMLAVAASASPKLQARGEPSAAEKARWVAVLPAAQKDDYLLRALEGEGTAVGRELLRAFRGSTAVPQTSAATGRTVGQIIQAFEEWEAEQKRLAAQKKTREQAAKAKKEAEERARHLQTLVGREAQLWRDVEAAIETSKPKEYDRAIGLLKDLRDLAERGSQTADFSKRLAALQEKYSRRKSLAPRLSALIP